MESSSSEDESLEPEIDSEEEEYQSDIIFDTEEDGCSRDDNLSKQQSIFKSLNFMKEINKEDFLAIELIRPKCINIQNDTVPTRPSGSLLDQDQPVEKQDENSPRRASAPNPSLEALTPELGTENIDVVQLVTALPVEDLPFKC